MLKWETIDTEDGFIHHTAQIKEFEIRVSQIKDDNRAVIALEDNSGEVLANKEIEETDLNKLKSKAIELACDYFDNMVFLLKLI